MKARLANLLQNLREFTGSLRFGGFTVLFFVILVLGVVVLSPQVTTFLNQRRDVVELQQQLSKLRAQQEKELKQLRAWDDEAFIRAEARNRLFYALPGESQLSVINDVEVTPHVEQTTEQSLTGINQNWAQNLLASTIIAGTTEAPKE